MQCHLNGLHISESPKFLADSLSEMTHAIQVIDYINTAHQQFLIQIHSVTSYFDMCASSIAESENEEIPKNHLTAEEPINRRTKRETHMMTEESS